MVKKPGQKKADAAPPPSADGFSLISNEKLLAIYDAMVRCRMLAKCMSTNGYANHANLHTCFGSEAVAAAVGVDLVAGDVLAPPERDLLIALVKGVPARILLRGASASAAPKLPGALESRGVLAPSASLNERMLRACADAAAQKAAKQGKLAVVFLDPAEPSDKPWHRALSLAVKTQLPMVFIRYAHHDEARNHARRGAKIKADEMPAIVVDGNDAVATYRVAFEAFLRARHGRGPTLIECQTYRLPTAKAADAADDPLLNIETYLARKGLYNPGLKSRIERDFAPQLDVATRFNDN